MPEFLFRRGTVEDLCNSARVSEHLDTLDGFIRNVNIQDGDITEENKDVNKVFASLNNTTKHVMVGLTNIHQLDNVVNMAAPYCRRQRCIGSQPFDIIYYVSG